MRLTDRSLAEQLGLHELEIKARKKFLEFGKPDAKNLEKVANLVETELDEIVELFYLKQLNIEEVALVIGDADSLKRLKSYQKQYIVDLFSGNYGPEYINNRLRIGLVHKRIGVETKHYISAMAQLKNILTEWISIGHDNKDEVPEILKSLEKLLNFDIQLVFDTYINTLISEIETSKNKVEDYAKSLEAEVRQRTRELEELSQQDPMTGLYNRRALETFLERDIPLARRHKQALSVIYLDMDGFKQINDVLGHQVGDELLVMVSTVLMQEARDTDIVCRMGGDEFCVILVKCNENDAVVVAERIIENFNQRNQEDCSLSIGISEYDFEHDGMDGDALIHRADSAMYESKKIKGNAITRYSEVPTG